MGAIRSLLGLQMKSLCRNSPWLYAALWKLHHESYQSLVCEDCYFDDSKSAFIYNSLFPKVEPALSSVKQLVERMNGLHAAQGSLIEKVASTKMHHWIFANEVATNSLSHCPENWKRQIACGVQTILLVPVIPLGVVQLGSFNEVAEDSSMVTHIKNIFCTGCSITNWPCIFTESPALINGLENQMVDKKQMVLDFVEETEDVYSVKSTQLVPLFKKLEADLSEGTKCGVDFVKAEEESTWQLMFEELLAESSTEGLNLLGNLRVADNTFEGDSCVIKLPEEKMNDNLSLEMVGMPNILDQKHGDLHRDGSQQKLISDHYTGNTPMEDLSDINLCAISGAADFDCPPEILENLLEESDSCFVNHNGIRRLLDPFIANSFYPSHDSVSEVSRCVAHSNSSGRFSDSCLTQFRTCGNSLRLKDPVVRSYDNIKHGSGEFEGHFPDWHVFKSNNLPNNADGEQEKKCHDGPKKRGRGNDPYSKPRPRDRQLIQERVKELRELIPRGSKCSIDALLDRTIKHMMFLQNVSSRAEKLRRLSQPKVNHEAGTYITQRNGASWAYQLGRQPEVCPLIVESLDQPGQVLVEVLCENYTLFLEIAQVIRSMQLTIIKGVLESREETCWAHFIIETSRGFHRMDVLWPLMQLLQRHRSPAFCP